MLAIAVLCAVLAALAATVWFIARADRPDGKGTGRQTTEPQKLGQSMAWIAVRTRDQRRLAELLGLRACRATAWSQGVRDLYDPRLRDRTVLVSPPIGDWVLVAGLSLPQPLGSGFVDKCTPLLRELSETFGEAQYFLTYPPLDYFGWLQALSGKVRRAFAMGDEGVLWDAGKQTSAEHALGLRFFELRGMSERSGDAGGALILAPTEAQVLSLAGQWSINPTQLTGDGHAGDGNPGETWLITRPARQWRPERALTQAA